VFQQINEWWRDNQQRKRTSIIYAYALGKAQRILSGNRCIDRTDHRARAQLLGTWKPTNAAGVKLPPTLRAEPRAHQINARH
jgi:putative mRNA 3-end processing factor